MQLHELQPIYKRKSKKRVGRGGKRGTYSGRGLKGQKARAGHRIRPAERDLIQRLPKLRGFKFRPLKPKPVPINLEELDKKLKGQVADLQNLRRDGLIKFNAKAVKILGNGEVKRPIEIGGLPVSASAKKKIEEAGGKVTR